MAGFCGEYAVKLKYERKFFSSRAPTLSKSFKNLHMPRNIADAQKRVRNFHKSDALPQTNKI